jgi:hypothetical protein
MSEKNIDGNPKQSTVYSWASASVTAAGTVAATNLTGVTGFTTLLSNFSDSTSVSGVTTKRVPTKIKVQSDGAAYLKINGGDVITLGATSPFEAEDLVIESLGISTGGDARTITVYLQ